MFEGRAGFTPKSFHQVPRLLSEFIPVDVCIATVSPMDRHGYMSQGVSADYTSTAARVAKLLILEVNEHMPRIHGRSSIRVSEGEVGNGAGHGADRSRAPQVPR